MTRKRSADNRRHIGRRKKPPPDDATAVVEQQQGTASQELHLLYAAFNFLYDGLRDAKRLFEAGDGAGREGAIHALETMLKFLSRFQPVLDEGLDAPLVRLFDALMNLDDGAVQPLLQHVPHRGGARASALRESMIGVAAFAVNRLCAAGLSAPEAYAFVARTLQAEGVTAARGRFRQVTVSTVRAWCDNVAADVDLKGQAAQTFKELAVNPELSPSPAADLEVAREFLAQHLVHVARSIRARENS